MDLSAINWLAVLAATLMPFVIGFVWYGPLFQNAWLRSAGLTKEQTAQGNMVRIFGLSLIGQFVMAFCLAMFFYGDPAAADAISAGPGALYGFLTGFGWVAMAICVTAQFEQKSWTYVLVNGSYWTVVLTLMGLILGAWK